MLVQAHWQHNQMNKQDIAQRIQREAGISEKEAASLLDWVLALFKSTLQKGEPVSIPNFGVFTVRDKASRMGRSPRTGEEIIIAPHRAVSFRASLQLKIEVNA